MNRFRLHFGSALLLVLGTLLAVRYLSAQEAKTTSEAVSETAGQVETYFPVSENGHPTAVYFELVGDDNRVFYANCSSTNRGLIGRLARGLVPYRLLC